MPPSRWRLTHLVVRRRRYSGLPRHSVSQKDAVVPDTANSTHKIGQVRIYVDGHTAHISGLLECVYAHTASEYMHLMSSSALPTPKGGIVYCETPAGALAIDAGRIRVHGGAAGTSYRVHDSYAV